MVDGRWSEGTSFQSQNSFVRFRTGPRRGQPGVIGTVLTISYGCKKGHRRHPSQDILNHPKSSQIIPNHPEAPVGGASRHTSTWIPRNSAIGSVSPGAQPIMPAILGFGLLNRTGEPSTVKTEPPDARTRATPAATSHSCFGTSVHVASHCAAATSDSL